MGAPKRVFTISSDGAYELKAADDVEVLAELITMLQLWKEALERREKKPEVVAP
jgi:hypothetical protein